MRLSDLREDLTQVEEIDFVGEFYPRRHITLIASAPGTGKTWLILQHAIDMVTGHRLLCGGKTEDQQPIKVVIFCGEAGGGIMADRIRLLGNDTPPEGMAIYTLSTFMRNNVPIALDTPQGIQTLRKIVEGEHADVVYVDTLISFKSEDESDVKSVSYMLKELRHIAEENNCAIVITHHLRKRKAREQFNAITQDDIIGTSAFTRLCAIAYTLSIEPTETSITVSCVKSWWKKPRQRGFRIEDNNSDQVRLMEIFVESGDSFFKQAMQVIRDMSIGQYITLDELTEAVGCSTSTASRAIKAATEERIIKLDYYELGVKHFRKIF